MRENQSIIRRELAILHLLGTSVANLLRASISGHPVF
jgi:hypothetical protein